MQINNYTNKLLLPFFFFLRKGYYTQLALMTIIEKWKTCLNEKGYTGAILMDLLKAFDIITSY